MGYNVFFVESFLTYNKNEVVTLTADLSKYYKVSKTR